MIYFESLNPLCSSLTEHNSNYLVDDARQFDENVVYSKFGTFKITKRYPSLVFSCNFDLFDHLLKLNRQELKQMTTPFPVL